MLFLDYEVVSSSNNRLISEKLVYGTSILQAESESLVQALTDEKRYIFNDIINTTELNTRCVYFVYSYGGAGKTFLWKTLSAALRAKEKIVLNVASSDIASLLLSGGRTSHSIFLIPLNLTEDSLCRIKPNSFALLNKTSLIIWDEAPMINKHAFEALDKTLKDILASDRPNNSNLPFGGKTIIFGGDFRQILPVVQSGGRKDIVRASLKSSYIWSNCKLFKLIKNMRLTVGNTNPNIQQTKIFARWLLDVGEEKVGGQNDGDATIEILDDLLITRSENPISDLIDFVYPSILNNFNDQNFFQDRVILAPTNEMFKR